MCIRDRYTGLYTGKVQAPFFRSTQSRLRAPVRLARRWAPVKEAAMKRLMKILLGLSIGAAVAMLFAPKSGRDLRERLIGGATGKLLPAAPVEFPAPEGERSWDSGPATAVAEAPVVEPAIVE